MRWRYALERNVRNVSRSKKEYMCLNKTEASGNVNMPEEEIVKVEEFKYFESSIQCNRQNTKKQKKCDRRIAARVKGKIYKVIVRPAMMYSMV